jgi:DinB family protein
MKTPIEVPDATRQPLAYRNAILALVGERDPLAIMAETAGRVASLLAGRGAAELAAPPAAGEWPATTILGHLVDVEIVFGFRWRLALTEDRPSYPGYDEKRWCELPRPPAGRLLTAFDVLREHNLTLLRGVPRSDWERVGVHGEQGPETVDVMVRKIAGHDLAHLDQLARALGG